MHVVHSVGFRKMLVLGRLALHGLQFPLGPFTQPLAPTLLSSTGSRPSTSEGVQPPKKGWALHPQAFVKGLSRSRVLLSFLGYWFFIFSFISFVHEEETTVRFTPWSLFSKTSYWLRNECSPTLFHTRSSKIESDDGWACLKMKRENEHDSDTDPTCAQSE